MDGQISTDTIFAVATPAGVGGIAVVRLSGPGSDDVLDVLTRAVRPALRRATIRRLLDEDGAVIDQALVIRFPELGSFTGERVVELHCHGGRAVTGALLSRLSRFRDCRLAEPGEFTRRALLNGRLDLAEVEALGDLIASETERQRAQAIEGLTGKLHRRAEAWREQLLQICAMVEVTIDWADEEVPEDVGDTVAEMIDALVTDFDEELHGAVGKERLRDGFEVAVIGPPNCGKSTFINMLAGREAAIASPIPGTTRDVIELRYDLSGLPVTFLDTAGLRQTDDPVESIGVSRAVDRARGADLRLHFRSSDTARDDAHADLSVAGDLTVWSKADLSVGEADHVISATTGAGVSALLAAIEARLADSLAESAAVVGQRQRDALARGRDHLLAARAGLSVVGLELVAEDVRSALRALEVMLGRMGIEDVLDRVFAKFCLGK